MRENKYDKINDITENLDLTPIIKKVIESSKSAYFKIMDGYSNWLDKVELIPWQVWISPNQISTLRTVIWTSLGVWIALVDWWIYEAPLIWLFWATLFHDAVDGYHARNTQQTSPEWETLDAWDDKIKVFILLWVLLASMSTSPLIINTLIIAYFTLLGLDIKSQDMRGNNIDAFKASWKKPLTKEERENNPNKKTKWASVSAWKAKTWVIMTGLTLWLSEDIPWLEWGNDNSIPVLITLLLSIAFSLKSLRDKWVRLDNFFKKERT